MDCIQILQQFSELASGWLIILFIIAISFVYLVALQGMQLRYFFVALKATICPSTKDSQLAGDTSPFHAFINTINSNLGNAVIAGIATAIYAGGPGAAFWFVFFGVVLMSVRFAEVYLSTLYASQAIKKETFGGPMLYLKFVPGGTYLPFIYAFFCVFYGLIAGNLIQANSMAVSLAATWAVPPLLTGIVLFVFVIYIFFGGAQRITQLSMSIVPVKVVVFMIASLIILLFHYQFLLSAFYLIVTSAFDIESFGGGIFGFSLQQMIAAGMSRSVVVTESGLGSAAIMFGATGNDDAIQNGFMGMISTLISTCIGFIVALCIVASGVWNSGLNGTALTIAAFDTVFGVYGGWIVSFLSISFGFGVMVSYAYVVRSAWMFVTGNRFIYGFIAIYSLCAFGGALATVDVVWYLADIILVIMLLINLYGLLMLLPKIRATLLSKLSSYRA